MSDDELDPTDDDLDEAEIGMDDVETDEIETDDVSQLVERLAAELRATEERPVERTASRWLGEAAAVASDAAAGDLTDDVVRERVGHVRDLLANVEATGDEAADERVERAKSLVRRVVDGR